MVSKKTKNGNFWNVESFFFELAFHMKISIEKDKEASYKVYSFLTPVWCVKYFKKL